MGEGGGDSPNDPDTPAPTAGPEDPAKPSDSIKPANPNAPEGDGDGDENGGGGSAGASLVPCDSGWALCCKNVYTPEEVAHGSGIALEYYYLHVFGQYPQAPYLTGTDCISVSLFFSPSSRRLADHSMDIDKPIKRGSDQACHETARAVCCTNCTFLCFHFRI